MTGVSWTEPEMAALRATFPAAPWPLVLAALPRRSRESINQQARLHGVHREVNKRAQWTDPEVAALRKLWPVAEQEILTAALPGRAWGSIGRKAAELGIQRRQPGARRNKRAIHPLIRQLRAERETQRVTRATLAERTGYAVGQIHGWEMGKARPLLPFVCDLAAALGLELVLRTSAERLLKEATPLVPMKRLMAGR